MEEKETWLPIPRLKGYEASSFGRIKSLERRINRSRNQGTQFKKECILKQYDKGIYLTINISLDGKTANYYSHHLIAEAFHGLCPDGYIVDHDDGNKRNNYPSNLVYRTQRQNVHKNKMQSIHGRGVSFNGSRYRARIRINGKHVSLGSYGTQAEAQEAFNNKLKEI